MPDVLIDTKDHVRIITLNRPERHNAVTYEMTATLNQAFVDAAGDDGVRAIVLRGNGKSFCSGRDTEVLGTRANDEPHFSFMRRHQMNRQHNVWDISKPFVAELKGAVLGGGCQWALAADIRIAGPDLMLGMPEIDHGLITDMGGSQLMTMLIGPSRTKYMMLGGYRIDAQTALDWGAVDFVVPHEELEGRVFEIAKRLASKSPVAMAMGKQIINQMHQGALRDAIGQELLAQTALFMGEDYAEARAARREKRDPVFKGR